MAPFGGEADGFDGCDENCKKSTSYSDSIAEASKNIQELNKELRDLEGRLKSMEGIRESVEAANRKIEDLQKFTEERPATNIPPEEQDNWTDLTQSWQRIKEGVEAIVNGIQDGRIRRKYNTMTRYKYDEILSNLVKDKELDEIVAENIKKLDELYRSYRNRKGQINNKSRQEFVKAASEIDLILQKRQ